MEKNGFQKREDVGEDYWNDPRWKEVQKLRDAGEHPRANYLVLVIREDWGVG